MIIYDILLIQVSTTVMDLVVVFALLVFMLALLCFLVLLPYFRWIKIYIYNGENNRSVADICATTTTFAECCSNGRRQQLLWIRDRACVLRR